MCDTYPEGDLKRKKSSYFLKSMPRKLGPERAHFDGPIKETHANGTSRNYWRCNYCLFEIGGKCFQNQKARIHLSDNVTLRNGVVAKICTAAPEHVKEQFSDLVKEKR